MATEREVLEALIKNDIFHDEDETVHEIAKKAIDISFNTLSDHEKDVLEPFMTIECPGVVNPGGHHNNCQTVLDDEELIAAVQQHSNYGAIICESCRNESDDYRRTWERIQAE
jgi:hypothetical protein